jgi:hypothetical protein
LDQICLKLHIRAAYKYSVALMHKYIIEAFQRAAALSLQVEVPMTLVAASIFCDRLIDTKYITTAIFKRFFYKI